jgi:hypothetical protein
VTSCVKIKVLDVPEMAQAGHNVHLTCDYDLERASLYQVAEARGRFLISTSGPKVHPRPEVNPRAQS